MINFGRSVGLENYRTQTIFEYVHETFYGYVLEHLEPARSEKTMKTNGFFLRKCLTVLDLIEGLWLVGKRFRR